MMKKFDRMCTMAYLKTTGFFRRLKSDERGLSDMVVAVLLILVGALAVVMLWGSLQDYLKNLWSKVTGTQDNFVETNKLPTGP